MYKDVKENTNWLRKIKGYIYLRTLTYIPFMQSLSNTSNVICVLGGYIHKTDRMFVEPFDYTSPN